MRTLCLFVFILSAISSTAYSQNTSQGSEITAQIPSDLPRSIFATFKSPENQLGYVYAASADPKIASQYPFQYTMNVIIDGAPRYEERRLVLNVSMVGPTDDERAKIIEDIKQKYSLLSSPALTPLLVKEWRLYLVTGTHKELLEKGEDQITSLVVNHIIRDEDLHQELVKVMNLGLDGAIQLRWETSVAFKSETVTKSIGTLSSYVSKRAIEKAGIPNNAYIDRNIKDEIITNLTQTLDFSNLSEKDRDDFENRVEKERTKPWSETSFNLVNVTDQIRQNVLIYLPNIGRLELAPAKFSELVKHLDNYQDFNNAYQVDFNRVADEVTHYDDLDTLLTKVGGTKTTQANGSISATIPINGIPIPFGASAGGSNISSNNSEIDQKKHIVADIKKYFKDEGSKKANHSYSSRSIFDGLRETLQYKDKQFKLDRASMDSLNQSFSVIYSTKSDSNQITIILDSISTARVRAASRSFKYFEQELSQSAEWRQIPLGDGAKYTVNVRLKDLTTGRDARAVLEISATRAGDPSSPSVIVLGNVVEGYNQSHGYFDNCLKVHVHCRQIREDAISGKRAVFDFELTESKGPSGR